MKLKMSKEVDLGKPLGEEGRERVGVGIPKQKHLRGVL